MWFLPSLKAQFPTLRIVHIVRDARDIAWSSQQVRLRRETRHTHASEKSVTSHTRGEDFCVTQLRNRGTTQASTS